MLKTNVLQDIIHTSIPDDIKVTINNLYIFVPNLIPTVQNQLMLIETTHKILRGILCWIWYKKTSKIRYDCSTWHRIGTISR